MNGRARLWLRDIDRFHHSQLSPNEAIPALQVPNLHFYHISNSSFFARSLSAIGRLVASFFTDTFHSDDEFDKFDENYFKPDSDYRKKQMAMEQRIKQEEADAAFARSLQGAGNLPPMSRPASTAPSAFDRMSGMSQSNARPSTNATSSKCHIKADPRSMGGYIKPEPQTMGYGSNPVYSSGSGFGSSNMNVLKPEPFSSRPMPGSFVDDSDSDIEIIEPSQFKSNGRFGQPNSNTLNRLSFSPDAQTAGQAALARAAGAASNTALQQAMYGSRAVPGWMAGGAASPQPTIPSPYNAMGSGTGMGMGNGISPGIQMYGSVPGAFV